MGSRTRGILVTTRRKQRYGRAPSNRTDQRGKRPEEMAPYTDPVIFAEFVPGHCVCTWSHRTDMQNPDGKPWVLKYYNLLCLAEHERPR